MTKGTEPRQPQAEPVRRGRHAKPEAQAGKAGQEAQAGREAQAGQEGQADKNTSGWDASGWGAPGWGEQEHRNNPYKDGRNNER